MPQPSPVALVTGASSGIGRATSRALRDVGWTVYAAARRDQARPALAADGFRAVRLDVTDEASMREGVEGVLREAGRIDLLVNNAGYGLNGPLETLPMADVRTQFETNVFGLLRMAQLVLPAMREQGSGRIVNVGSIGGTLTLPGVGAYHATKYAVEAISDALRVEVGQFGVDVVLVQPTGVRTPFFEKMDESTPEEAPRGPYARFMEGYRRGFAQATAGGPSVIGPDDVARVIVQAAAVESPWPRYKAGWSAYAAAAKALLPDRAWDAAMRRVLGIPGPAAAVRRANAASTAPRPATAEPQGSA